MQEKTPNLIKKPEEIKIISPKMKAFYEDIADLKEKREKGEISNMIELLDIKDVFVLTEEDQKMWERINNKEEANLITEEDFKTYKSNVKDSKNESREEFLAIIVQKITSIWLSKQTKERDDKKRK